MNSSLTPELAKQRFEKGLPVLIGTVFSCYPPEVMLNEEHEPDFDYKCRVYINHAGGEDSDLLFFALKQDNKNGNIIYDGVRKFSHIPVVPETGEEMVEIIVQRREIYVQEVSVWLPKSTATIEDAIETVADGGGEEVFKSLEYVDTTHSDYWTVFGPTPELSREFPKKNLDIF